MKNLESLQLIELNPNEVREVEGGWVILGYVAAVVAIAVAYVEAVDTFYEAGNDFGKELTKAALN